MSDLTFNKYAGAVLATAFVIAGLVQLSGGMFSEEKVAKPGFKVDVVEEAAGGAAVPDVPPDWGTVLKTADISAGQATFAKCQSCHNADNGGANGTGPKRAGYIGTPLLTRYSNSLEYEPMERCRGMPLGLNLQRN